MVLYVNEGNDSAFCGYDGMMWTPLSEDTTTHWLCKGVRGQACTGELPKNLGDASHGGKVLGAVSDRSNVVLNGSETYVPRWDAEAAKWVDLPWNFNVVNPGECSYQCGVGYHPGGYGMDGSPSLNCKECSYITNMYDWKSAGTGEDNCAFGCKASFFYNGSQRSCTNCSIGTYTAPDGHQSTSCTNCQEPKTLNAPVGEKGLLKFTSNGTGQYACDFDCKERYSYYFSYDADNSCTWCAVGTYSSGGKMKVCNNCTNKP